MRPIWESLPALVESLKSSGLVQSMNVNLDISHKNVPVQSSYSLLHLTGEVLRWIGTTDAKAIDIRLTASDIAILSDIQIPDPDPMTARLCLAFAQELGGTVDWSARGMSITFTDAHKP